MTVIAAVAAPTTPASVLPATPRTAAPAAPASRADQPAVINDVVSQAASGAGPVNGELLTGLRGKINQVLEDIGSHNSFAWLDKHTNREAGEAKVGKAKMDENRAIKARFGEYRTAQVTQGVADLQDQTSVSGLSLTRKEDGSFAVSEFSFTDAGSTYTIKQSTDGRMTGLKDGQGWRTWQVEPPASSIGAARAQPSHWPRSRRRRRATSGRCRPTCSRDNSIPARHGSAIQVRHTEC